jgi:hypothetical protein
MPISLTTYTDLEIPTPNGDPTTYGVIINQFFEDLTTKIADLATRISAAEASLGDTSTANTILYNIAQVTNINSLLQADGVTSDKLLTGTSTTLLPDPYSGNYTTTSTFPAFTGTGEALENIDPPETESEILNFDFVAFRNALNGILNIISTRVAQTEADILQARIDVCKAKAYIDAYNAGGTTEKYYGTPTTYYWTNPDNGSSSGSYLAKADYTIGLTSVGNKDFTYNNGLLTVIYNLVSDPVYPYGNNASTNLQAHNRLTSNGYLTSNTYKTCYSKYKSPSDWNVGDEVILTDYQITIGTPIRDRTNYGNVYAVFDGAIVQIRWISNGLYFKIQLVPGGAQSQSQVNAINIDPFLITNLTLGLTKHSVAEQTIYGTPDVSYCETTPGGPHFTSGSYT